MFRECLHCLYFMKLNIYAEQTLLHMFSPIDPKHNQETEFGTKTFSASNFKSFVVGNRTRIRVVLTSDEEDFEHLSNNVSFLGEIDVVWKEIRLTIATSSSSELWSKIETRLSVCDSVDVNNTNSRHKSNWDGFVFTAQPNSPLKSNQGLKVKDTISKWNVQLSDSIMSSERERS